MKTISVAKILVIAVFLIIMDVCGAVCGEAIKVGDEVVLMGADGPGKTRRGKPAVAFGKDVFLVVWQEGWCGYRGSSRIYAARVGLDGKALDPKAVEIAPCKTGVQENPRVAFFNGVFLVVWQDMRSGKDCDVLGARVSPEGKVLDARPIAIAVAPRTQAMPDVAADDKGFMVVWHGFQGEEMEAKAFAARVGPDGTAGRAVAVPTGQGSGASPRIAWNGKDFLLVCSKLNSMRWLRMDAAGKPLSKPVGAHGSFGTPFRYSTCALPAGKGWVVVSHGSGPNFWGRTVGLQRVVRVTADGRKDSPRDSIYFPKGAAPPANWLDTNKGKKGVWPYGGSAVAADGQYCVAVWQRYHLTGPKWSTSPTRTVLVNGDIVASRVDGWKPLDKDGVPVAATAAEELDPALAGNGAGALLCVYEKVEEGKSKIAARTLQTR